jgi:hypothetical protein
MRQIKWPRKNWMKIKIELKREFLAPLSCTSRRITWMITKRVNEYVKQSSLIVYQAGDED